MPFPDPQHRVRDGTSQSARALEALDPSHVAVDERRPQDWLAFVRRLSASLRFVDPALPLAEIDWSGLVGDDVDLDRVVAYMEDPAAVSEAEAARFGRPHFALLLAFLRLVGVAQEHMGALTRRHLDFFFSDVLRMEHAPPRPDQVSLVLRPSRGVDAVRIPAGTEFTAGKDSGGAVRVYRTDRDRVVNRAVVGELRSLYVDQRVTGIREARERRDPGTDPSDRFLRMFAYALGEPEPGDPLPPFVGAPVDLPRLIDLRGLVEFAGASLSLDLYEVRALAQLKRRRDGADDDWAAIVDYLEIVGRERTGDGGWTLSPADPRDFRANLDKALGATADASYFAGLPEVESIDDLYRQHLLETAAWVAQGEEESDVAKFIRERLYFRDAGDFEGMMALKRRSDADWAEVVRLLERAGQRRRGDRAYRLDPADPADYAANFAAALGDGFAWPPGIAGVEAYDAALAALEAYFFMSAETFAYVMAAAPDRDVVMTPKQWQRIYGMLAAAHRSKVYAGRRAALAGLRAAEGWRRTLYAALGEDPSAGAESPLPQLRTYVERASDYAFLQGVDAALAASGGDEAAIDGDTWARAIQIVELAQRVREAFPTPVARRVEWRNLYPYADATALEVRVGLDSDVEAPRWHTFGAKPALALPDAPPTASFGWAIASPMLALREGARTITLTLGLGAAGMSAAKIAAALEREALVVEVTTAKAWVVPSTIDVKLGDYAALSGVERPLAQPLAALQLTLTFPVEVDAIAAMPYADSGIASEHPAVRLTMRQLWDADEEEFVTLYEPFRALELAAVHLRTDVAGLAAIEAATDRGGVNVRRPFEPFTLTPAVGSRLFFSHPELAQNALDSLTLRLQWMGAPADLGAHYVNYGLDAPTNATFTAAIAAVDRRRRFVLAEAAPLFADGDAGAARAIAITQVPAPLGRDVDFRGAGEVTDWSRYFEVELTPTDLQHGRYGVVANQTSVAFAAAIAKGQAVSADDYRVNPPYTPKLRALTVDYTSSTEVVLDGAVLTGEEELFHVRPFGAHAIAREEGALAYRLFPAHDEGGELLIGLRGVAAPQHVALLVQLAEGSADPDLEPVAVEWSYLSGDRWCSLHHGDLLADTTRGLINSGIVELALPAAAPSTQLPPALYWIRVAIPRSVDSVCDVVAIDTQAVSATFVDRGNADDHYAQPLPAGSVVGPLVREPRLATVAQPYTSYGGGPRERDEVFRVRVSERLRHKQRALTIWDYERLVLGRFPDVYKVKCIPAASHDDADTLGLVDVVVIPDIRDKLPFDPFEPKVSADGLADIAAFLAPLAPPFARLQVRNARYVEVKARFGVRFRAGVDVGFYRKRLSEELSRFLSPWAYEEGADIVIGGRIYANSVIDFVDRRDYVDHLATIKLFRSRDGRDFELVPAPVGAGGEGYFVAADHPDEILVAARTHEIDVITDVTYDSELFTGIGHMKVELDFVVG
ncbi:MAG: hypothetical protein R3A79_13675 [Nannocystaceae bacterium]